MIKFFTTNLTTAKKTLIGSMIFATIGIGYVNWKKISDKDSMKIAVNLDKERLQARGRGQVLTLEDQRKREREQAAASKQ